jgi:hypothetical protein
MYRVMAWAVLGVLATAPIGWAADGGMVTPASGLRHRSHVAPLYCPPCLPAYPPGTLPGTLPTYPPGTPGVPTDPSTPPGTPPGMPPDPSVPPPVDPRITDPFAQATEAGGLGARSFNENFDGDFVGVFYSRVISTTVTIPQVVGFTQRVVGTTQTVTVDAQGNRTIVNTPVVVTDPVIALREVTQQRVVQIPAGSRYNGVQIVDNDNPRPMDRVYFGYNHYSDVGSALNPGVGGSDIQRQMMGFEKTFLGGDASFGMRLPFIQQYGPFGLGDQQVGDLSLLWKYAFYNNRVTGDVASVGFVLTTPTGGGHYFFPDGTEVPHSWLFQPWAGFVKVYDRAYVQGISNIIIPSDSRDPTMWGNSLAVGYWLYRNPGDRVLNGIIPTAEVHVRTPLSNRDENGLIFLQDQVNITGGVHFRFTRATISGAVCIPVVGPRPWDIEAMGFINYRF